MHTTTGSQITRYLNAAAGGDKEAENSLWSAVYNELRRIAHRELAHEQREHTLSTTDLVHEAYFRLVDHRATNIANRSHFYAVACRAIRNVLVDFARRRSALKRGGGAGRVPLSRVQLSLDEPDEDVLAVDAELERLANLSEEMARVVELRFFGGFTMEETADIMQASKRSTERLWTRAKLYLHRAMEESQASVQDR